MMPWFLQDAVVVTMLLGTALTLSTSLRRRSAAERHWILALGVVCALAVPVLRAVLPVRLALPVQVSALPSLVAPPPATRGEPTSAGDSVVVDTATAFRPLQSAAAPRLDLAAAVVWLWLGGVALALTRLGIGLARLRRLVTRAVVLESGPWRDACDALSHALQLSTPVQLLHGRHPSLLATWGWRRPVVLLPRDAPAWPPERIRVVLAHELAHVARRDWIHQLAAEGLRALHWFNPLAWRAGGQLRIESERASDDIVLALGIDAPAYAEHLVDLARRLRQTPPAWVPAPALIRPSSLEGRIRAMLDPTLVRQPPSHSMRRLMAAAALALTLPLAAVSAAAQYYALRGTIIDPTGRALPNATVVLTNTASAARYEVRSDAAGRFEFVGLVPASYALEARTLGFRTHAETIAIAEDTERALRLAVGTLQETISVIGDGRPDPAPDAEAIGPARGAARPRRRASAAGAGDLRRRSAGGGRRQHPATAEGRRRAAAIPRTAAPGRRRWHGDDEGNDRRRGARTRRRQRRRLASGPRIAGGRGGAWLGVHDHAAQLPADRGGDDGHRQLLDGTVGRRFRAASQAPTPIPR